VKNSASGNFRIYSVSIPYVSRKEKAVVQPVVQKFLISFDKFRRDLQHALLSAEWKNRSSTNRYIDTLLAITSLTLPQHITFDTDEGVKLRLRDAFVIVVRDAGKMIAIIPCRRYRRELYGRFLDNVGSFRRDLLGKTSPSFHRRRIHFLRVFIVHRCRSRGYLFNLRFCKWRVIEDR